MKNLIVLTITVRSFAASALDSAERPNLVLKTPLPGEGEEPTIVGENQMLRKIKATPAIVRRAIYLRTDSSLYRIEKSERNRSGQKDRQ